MGDSGKGMVGMSLVIVFDFIFEGVWVDVVVCEVLVSLLEIKVVVVVVLLLFDVMVVLCEFGIGVIVEVKCVSFLVGVLVIIVDLVKLV